MIRVITNVSKGRANAARPLLCLGLALLFALTGASAAAAALRPPILTDTNPASPSASPTPRVEGEIEGAGTKAVLLGARLSATGPITRELGEPANVVKLYTAAGCTGPVVGEGSAEELVEGGGIQVAPVAADSVTVFYATQGNGVEVSACSSQGLPYRQVTTPPAAPSLDSVSPTSPANDNFPHLIGVADPEATVSIFSGAGCGGTALASGTGTEFGATGIAVSVPDNSETTFSARAGIAGFSSSCSASPISYREVTPATPPGDGGNGGGGGGGGIVAPPATLSSPPPMPQLRTIPGGWSNDDTPLLTGTAPGASTVRIYAAPGCAGPVVAKGTLDQFLAGIPVRVVDNVVTVFSALSVSGSGKASPCSDPVPYLEDSLTPHTRITMGPASKTAKRKAVFRFMDTTGDTPGTTFFCRLDKRRWKRCASPLRLQKLRPRAYLVEVKATDPAGNAEGKGAKRRFKVVPAA